MRHPFINCTNERYAKGINKKYSDRKYLNEEKTGYRYFKIKQLFPSRYKHIHFFSLKPYASKFTIGGVSKVDLASFIFFGFYSYLVSA